MQTLTQLACAGKTVFLRVDFNVPLDDKQNIRDDTRIRAAIPTIKHLIKNDARLIIASHLGRPKGRFVPELSMEPVGRRLQELLSQEVFLASGIIGPEVDKKKKDLKNKSILLLQNLRFDPGEKSNDPEFTRGLASGIDIYVNDAFGTCHRAHASVVGIPSLVKESAAGFLIIKEVEYLNRVIHSPQKPFVAVLGGAKVTDKIPVIRNLIVKADTLLIGGAMAYTFFASQGKQPGRSLVETDKIEIAQELLQLADKEKTRLLLPEDHICAAAIESPQDIQTVTSFPFPDHLMGLDIGPRTIAIFHKIISSAKTIFWNGPMGVFENECFSTGTMSIARSVASSSALSIVGGGDSIAAILKAGVSDTITHISTGGGASLEYIANETLPGLEALKEK